MNNAVAMFAPEGKGVRLPPFPGKQPIGFAASATADGAQKQLYIPADVVKDLAMYILQVRFMLSGEK